MTDSTNRLVNYSIWSLTMLDSIKLFPWRCAVTLKVNSCMSLFLSHPRTAHLGFDGRYYCLDFARVFPPEKLPSAYHIILSLCTFFSLNFLQGAKEVGEWKIQHLLIQATPTRTCQEISRAFKFGRLFRIYRQKFVS